VVDLTPQQFEDAWKSNCYGGFLSSKEVLPNMLKEKKGTIIFTGATAALRGAAMFSSFAVGKFGLRALSQSLARECGPQGVHVCHVVIDGRIDQPQFRQTSPEQAKDSFIDPDQIANTYWFLHSQHQSSWTQEMDLRPSVEKF